MPKLRVVGVAAALLGVALLAGRVEVSDRSGEGVTENADQQKKQVEVTDVVPAEQVHLISVTDGDTLAVGLPNGSRANVRLIGIDTPETYPQLECGGGQATENMRELVKPGDALKLYTDLSQDAVDRYGRLLRYVFTSADLDVGLDQVGTGHATVYVYGGNPFADLDAYQDAEDEARSHNGGIWGAC